MIGLSMLDAYPSQRNQLKRTPLMSHDVQMPLAKFRQKKDAQQTTNSRNIVPRTLTAFRSVCTALREFDGWFRSSFFDASSCAMRMAVLCFRTRDLNVVWVVLSLVMSDSSDRL